jgi:hypothetical protein
LHESPTFAALTGELAETARPLATIANAIVLATILARDFLVMFFSCFDVDVDTDRMKRGKTGTYRNVSQERIVG